MYKYVVFDFDGTLIDSNYLIDRTIRATAEEVLDQKIGQVMINNIWGKVLTEQMAELDSGRVEELCQYYSNFYRQHRDEHTTIFEGILDMLEVLHKTCKMAIITNKGRGGLEHGLHKFNMKNYFEIALSKSDVVMKKPHPEGLYKVMEHFKAKAEDVLFIGDSIHDIACGKNAGVDTILVAWTVMDLDKLKLENPTYIVNEPNDIVDIVNNKKNF